MDQRARAKDLPTATISDAMDVHGIAGVMDGIVRRSGTGRVAGYARTVREYVLPFGTHTGADFAIGPLFDDTDGHSVLVIEMSADHVSTMGGLAALTASLRQAAAVVVNGGCRDIEDIRSTGLTVGSRFVTPRTGKGRVKVAARDEAVSCGGVTVHPGDLVVGDDTGFVAIPKLRIDAVLETAESIKRRDEGWAEKLRAGATFTSLLSS